jgi:SAM-dependent methyltransferase
MTAVQAGNSDVAAAVNRWFSQYPGTLLLEQERAAMEAICRHYFGYHLLQIGAIGGANPGLLPARLRARTLVSPERPQGEGFSWVRGVPNRLPIAGDSVDVLVLPHTLEFYASPHEILREADRVLIPEGKLLVVGFNPWSPWGLGWNLRHWQRKLPAPISLISPRRLHDWLSLLGFRVEVTQSMMYRPPLRQRKLMARLDMLERFGERWWPHAAGVYLIEATKRVSTLTPIKPHWSLRRSLLGGRAIEPSTHVPLNRGVRRG